MYQFKQKAKFNKKEALLFWSQGYCWGALGKKYGYTGNTIKKHVGEYAGIEEYSQARESQRKNHKYTCPKCYSQESRERAIKRREKARKRKEIREKQLSFV